MLKPSTTTAIAVIHCCGALFIMDRVEQLRTSIGKVGFFFNDENEKTHRVGRLKSVTPNGNCEDEDGCYYDNFTPMRRADLLECIDSEFFS